MRLPLLALILLALVPGPAAGEISLLPQPASAHPSPGEFRLDVRSVIVSDSAGHAEGRRLAQMLASATGLDIPVRGGRVPRNHAIHLIVDSGLPGAGDEGYQLKVGPKRVTLRARTAQGLFRASQTMLQLLPPAIYSPALLKPVDWTLPSVRIEDQPRFRWRGVLIDPARHFIPKAEIFRFIDEMVLLKLNVLQIHLTDNQGWRIEIRSHPCLTAPETLAKELQLRQEGKWDGGIHAAFYTQDDLRQIVAYAAARYVTVVPEIEIPGHAGAAIEACPELGNNDSKYGTEAGRLRPKKVLNANESTIRFLQDVLGEVLEIFPSPFIHIGGDEVRMDEWLNSAQAQARMKELGIQTGPQLESYIIHRMDRFLTSKGRRLVGWDEILEGGLAPGATVMSWRGTSGGIRAAQAGHDVVMAPTDHTYLDYYQSKNPEEPPAIHYYLDLETVYRYEPIPAELTAEQARHILGVQGQLWGEYISSTYHREYMAYPRLAALAEVAWSPQARDSFAAFRNRLKVQQQRWRAMGVNYRP